MLLPNPRGIVGGLDLGLLRGLQLLRTAMADWPRIVRMETLEVSGYRVTARATRLGNIRLHACPSHPGSSRCICRADGRFGEGEGVEPSIRRSRPAYQPIPRLNPSRLIARFSRLWEWGEVMRPFAPLSLCRKRYELLRLAGTATCVQPLFGAGSSPADGVHVPSV